MSKGLSVVEVHGDVPGKTLSRLANNTNVSSGYVAMFEWEYDARRGEVGDWSVVFFDGWYFPAAHLNTIIDNADEEIVVTGGWYGVCHRNAVVELARELDSRKRQVPIHIIGELTFLASGKSLDEAFTSWRDKPGAFGYSRELDRWGVGSTSCLDGQVLKGGGPTRLHYWTTIKDFMRGIQ